ncbi:MAG: transporter substrate-binding domain-containing protein [Deltaproteobacteria bacterium]
MKTPFLLALALAGPALALAAPPTESTAPACAELVITGHPYYPPVSWGSGGKLKGAAPELVARLATGLGVLKITSKDFGTWEKAQEAARSGEADIIFGIYRNRERMEYLEYLDPPFMLDPVSVVVREGAAFPYERWSDLIGKKGVTNAGESYGDKFDTFLASELTVARVAGMDKAFAAVLDGTADYAIIAFYPGRDLLRKKRLSGKVVFLPKTVVAADMYVAFSKKSKCLGALKEGFAKGLKSAVDGGRARELIQIAEDSLSDQ